MRNAKFEVPANAMVQFAGELAKKNLDHTIMGINKYEEIVIEVMYNKDESELVDELEEILDELTNNENVDDENEDDE